MTNFDMSRYDVKSIANSSLPIGGLSSKTKTPNDSVSVQSKISHDGGRSDDLSSPNSSVTFASQPPPSSSPASLSFAIPIKQDASDNYWSSVLAGYNKNPSFQSSSTNASVTSVLPFNLEFSTHTSSESNNNDNAGNNNNNNNNAFFSGGMFGQQQSGGNSGGISGSSSLIPLGTPIALNSNSSYEISSGYGNWSIGSTLHAFQTHAKPSLFQTPIFGIE